ncbi:MULTISPECIES: hypothetical protein [Ralstonia solanacearum species complex]|uniref:Uncharacterized protein n=2 Tax=Ralstonia syzygii TaxID=28097 RepID=G3A2F5_9RALS|nr:MULTISPECIES: hypothetical protein [Ralstonia solanacearum species complex]MDO3514889.1 hypothetical protein [Ralstonia pseudosolanacearum]MDO3633474.1 hypothetical protein [Ralstonia pseudosolanacearum]QUP54499.1 hypothetical protein GO998_12470 [Ralstonia syzygii]CCA85600.1 hypothetical protein RALSY_20206 [Ralstonia syzygii R24]
MNVSTAKHLDATTIEVLLAQGQRVNIHIGQRQVTVYHDGTHYRCGMLRAKTLDTLKALYQRMVR